MSKLNSPIEIKSITKSKITSFFKQTSSLDVNQLRLTNISLYSVTPWKEANRISNWILQFYTGSRPLLKPIGSSLTITDATANVGGNAISFHLNGFGLVNVIEKDELTAKLLNNNLKAYGLTTNNVYCCDYLSIYDKLEQDVIFLDPPWGGPNYKNYPLLDLFLGKINVADLSYQILNNNKASLIVLKVPVNYNFTSLQHTLKNCTFCIRKVFRHKFHSYNIIFCYKNSYSKII